MASVPEDKERSQIGIPDAKGMPTFAWQTTSSMLADAVKLTMPPSHILPIVFVPGIMGSNLASTEGDEVWVLNKTAGAPLGLAMMWAKRGSGTRQKVLHPKRTQVYREGAVPKKGVGTIRDKAHFLQRGWGEVSEASYHKFLLWLEQKMNGEGYDPAYWGDFSYTSVSAAPKPGEKPPPRKLYPGISMDMSGLPRVAEDNHATAPILSDELLKRAKCRFPVYACGYNWLASNTQAAEALKERIAEVIAENNKGAYKCEQVILVTHSMGGLVARSCAQLDGMADKIAGIVHGVMPAVGAAVAYRRCKVGMREESFTAGLVIGSNGREVTAVFAQAPGALQLLPSVEYGPHWLNIKDDKGHPAPPLPNADPYTEIYLERSAWWGLVREEWLSPKDGLAIKWNEFAKNVKLAKAFHDELAGQYHAQTYVFYGGKVGDGDGYDSFEKIHWQMKRGMSPGGKAPDLAGALAYGNDQVRTDGSNKLYMGGKTEFMPDYSGYGGGHVYETSYYEISCGMQDGHGDGTVPASSGRAPRKAGGGNIKQQFKLSGFEHEPAYSDAIAQKVTHYAITKIAAIARLA